MRNNPRAALPALEAALTEDPANIQTYQYLGIVYLQLERPEDAVSVYLRALPRGGVQTPVLAFNLGNAWFVTGNYGEAIRYYSEALEANPAMTAAWLNRANARVRSGALAEAVEDYRRYLALEPRSPQSSRIQAMVSFITEEFAAEERRRVALEERARQEAERARVEAERRQRLLEEVSASLQADAGESRSVSAGTESPHAYEGEFELD
jgi:tetratricopeptide (TPR) repeat protein